MKTKLLQMITYLPIGLNMILMKLNKSSEFIYGKEYAKYKTLVRRNAIDYDNNQDLINLVNHAIVNVPYYKNRYKKIKDIAEFQSQFDFIDKDIISENFNDFLDSSLDKSKYMLGTTGGTGGNPLKMYIPKNRHIVELGTMHNLWKNVGFDHDIRAVIRNKKLPVTQDYVINPITKEIIFDGFRLNEAYFQTIYDVIKKYKIPYIHAYPSTAYEFSRYLVKNNLQLPSVRAFLCGSENVYDYQKKFIREKAKIQFYNWYGHSEKLVLAGYCKHSDVYHVEPTYGYFELIDTQGKPITTPGTIGEIVATTLHNYGMPMIRYRTDDYAEYVGDYCEHCKRYVPLIKNIQGRWNGSKIYGADGSVTTTTALNFHDDLYLYLAGLQYVQKEKGKLEVLIIKGEGFKDEHHKRLKEYYHSKFSKDTQIDIKYVDQLLRKPNGKFVELISEIKE